MEAEKLRLDLVQKRTELKVMGKGLKVSRVWGTKLLVETVKPWTEMDEYTAKGLHIPEDARSAREAAVLPSTGIVLMLGEELKQIKSEQAFVSVGDLILFSRFSGSDHRISEEAVKIIDISEILAVLESSEALVEVLASEAVMP